MRSVRQVRVLMLGWEYPPRFVGGMGKACQGLSQAMAKLGAHLFFVLPTFPERVSEQHLEVIGAEECLEEAGWIPEVGFASQVTNAAPQLKKTSGITLKSVDAQIYPYGAHPQDPLSENLRQVIERMSTSDFFKKPDRKNRVTSKIIPKVQRTIKNIMEECPSRSSSEIYGKNLWSEIERYCFAVRHLADAHEVDLVHAHDWMTFPAAFEFQRVTGVPVYLHVHATEYDRSGDNLNHEVFRIEREGFRRANHIFAVSRYTAGIIERLYGVHRKKISVVYNAPEEGIKSLLSIAESDRRFDVVFLGRLTFQKGPDHFLKAAALVSQANSTARFVLCGTGDMLDKLRAQAFKLGIEDRVHFAGFVEPAGVDEILQHSKVLVMPSVSEPFGLVALEAIHCGIPVILSKQSGVREVLQRALQVDFWDHERLADQILAALRLEGLSKQLVSEGMDQLRLLSWEKSAGKVMEVYRKHLGSIYAQAIGGIHGH